MNESPTISSWWIWAVSGAVTLAVGIIVLFEPGKSLEALSIITGIYLLFDAALAFARAISGAASDRGLAAMHGVVDLVIGLILVRHPIETISFIAILIGIWLLTIGCVITVSALQSREHRGTRLVIGLVQAIAGAVIIAQPSIGYNTLAIIAGISLAVQGIGMLALAWSQRKLDTVQPST